MDLIPPDLLREISGRLQYPADFVRFHAVCRPWRDSRSGDLPMFPPWLVAPADNMNHKSSMIRCVFSKTTYRAGAGPSTAEERNWVANADGTAVRHFTTAPCPGLQDTLGCAHTLPLPPFPNLTDPSWGQMENPHGIVYGDGTILLFTNSSHNRFMEALLRPGDAAWTLVQRNLESKYGEVCCVYHDSKIMVTVDASTWYAIATNNVAQDDVQIPRTWPRTDCFYLYGCALETRGELLWVLVHLDLAAYQPRCGPVGALEVSVHTLHKEVDGPETKLRWVRKDGRSLADRVLFLGWPNSFAVDASRRLRGDGGCAYFVYENGDALRPSRRFGVFRYNLVDEENELVEWLPKGWTDERCTWLLPQPVISPI